MKSKVHSIKTDNASVSNKAELRKQATAHLAELRVLDLFAGNNILWGHFKCARYYGVEEVKGKGKNLRANNIRVIESLDLSGFNVIDLDSYGIPFNQLVLLFENSTLAKETVIIYTCISGKMNGLNKKCLEHYGLSGMYRKCKTLLNALSTELFYGWLYDKNIKTVKVQRPTLCTSLDKEYGYFIV